MIAWLPRTVLVLLVSYALSNLVAAFIAVSGNSLALLRLYHQYCLNEGSQEKVCLSQTNEPRNTGLFAVGIGSSFSAFLRWCK